jgi:hypothetical protein
MQRAHRNEAIFPIVMPVVGQRQRRSCKHKRGLGHVQPTVKECQLSLLVFILNPHIFRYYK